MGSSEQDLLGDLLTIFFISSVVQGRRLLSTLLSPVLCVIASVSVSENPFRIFSILEMKKLLKFSAKSSVEEDFGSGRCLSRCMSCLDTLNRCFESDFC